MDVFVYFVLNLCQGRGVGPRECRAVPAGVAVLEKAGGYDLLAFHVHERVEPSQPARGQGTSV